jgi:phospholipid/cholesterol/gamma-HCH transport system substrate-binding protein
MIRELNTFTAKLNTKGNLFNDLATDTLLVGEIRNTMESFKATAQNSEEMTEELKAITSKINSGDNAMGLLLNDKGFAQTLKSTMESTDSAAYNLNRGLEALEYTWPFRGGFRKKAKEEAKSDN